MLLSLRDLKMNPADTLEASALPGRVRLSLVGAGIEAGAFVFVPWTHRQANDTPTPIFPFRRGGGEKVLMHGTFPVDFRPARAAAGC